MPAPIKTVKWSKESSKGVPLFEHREQLVYVLSSACFPVLNWGPDTHSCKKLVNQVRVGKEVLRILECTLGYFPIFPDESNKEVPPNTVAVLNGRFYVVYDESLPDSYAVLEDDFDPDKYVVVEVV